MNTDTKHVQKDGKRQYIFKSVPGGRFLRVHPWMDNDISIVFDTRQADNDYQIIQPI